MDNLKKFVSHLLVLSMMVQTSTAFGYVQPDEFDPDDEVLTPQNPPGTPEGVQCSVLDETPNLATGGVCCVGLELNSAGKCDEPAFKDPAVTKCTSVNQCSPGLGCFPQTTTTLYTGLYPTPDDDVIMSEKRQELQSQIYEIPNPKPIGGTCVHARDCQSYSCVGGICEDIKICRKAAEGEFAGAGVSCGPDLVRNTSGICELSAEAQNGTYLGLLNQVSIEPQGQCQFKLDDETRKRSLIAMQSLRAMEWFFSTISVDKNEECFDVLPVAKDEIGKKFFESRKNILANFTEVLNNIEDDYMKVLCSRQPDDKTTLPPECASYAGVGQGTATLVVHGDSIAEPDLASRQTSGYDTLWLMKRRNQLFQAYENAMLETVTTAQGSITGLNERLSALKDDTVLPNCEGSKYKKKKFLGSWKTKYYNHVRDHWAFHYDVTGNVAANANIVKRENVKKVLAIIGGTTEDQAVANFTKSKYYLMDPMMFGGIKNSSYGEDKPLKKKSSFLGIFGGFKDLRKARYLKGSGTGSYTKMYNDLTPKLKEFYKTLKARPEQKGFVYEPELLTTQAKDCLNNPEKPEGCKDFAKFLEGVQDETFAHFLAWGHSNRDSYDGFFTNAKTYRRQLLRKIITDMQNISMYYTRVIEYRNEQNRCIDDVLGGIADSGILTFESGGLNQGSVLTRGANGGSAGGTLNSLTGTGSKALNNAALQKINRTKFMYDLKGSTLTKLKDGALYDSIVGEGNTSDRAGIGSTSSAFLAQREDAMRRANAKAKAKGVDIASKEKAVKDVIDSMTARNASGSGSGALGASSASTSGSGSGFGQGSAGQAGVSANTPGAGSNVPEGVSGNAGEIDPNKVAAATSGASSGIGSGFGSGYDAGSGSGSGAEDPNARDSTGLTEADKERMLSEYERNKKAYEENEEDGLFNKVSKAYVRNLEKVLNRKKKIEP